MIRYGALEDAVLLAEMGARTFYDAFAADNEAAHITAYISAAFHPRKLAAELADPANLFLIAELDGEAVGYAKLRGGTPPAAVSGENPIELERIYVLQERIGHGMGAALMQACLDEAAQRGHDVLWLGVWERNARGLEFYAKWGFTRVGEHTFMLGPDVQTDALLQRKVAA